ncbi:glycosyltransferase family 2 protein [Mariniflexile jejuense]|uniref:Glycosyltransferase family 2 protein n=1 Tax=Mariniflexile jejuense TaxID=1173582 RepID=A0ABW3JH04_9FLAO
MKNSPLVSILIPTFNGEKYITDTLNSVIKQTYKNLEIIISDDASMDGTLAIVDTYISKTNIPIKIFDHKPSGIGANWNYCLSKAQGEYIKFLFQDDFMEPNCIEKMMGVFKKNNDVKMVLCKRHIMVEEAFKSERTNQWINTYGDLQKDLNLKQENSYKIIDKTLFMHQSFLIEPLNKFGEPSVILFKKEIIDTIGNYREDLIQALDFEFCNRIILKYKAALLDEKLVTFRLHLNQATTKNAGNHKDLDLYDTIVYNHYFWYLNNKNKKLLLKKHNEIVKLLLKIKRKLGVKL